MRTIIISIEALINSLSVHILAQEPFGKTITVLTCYINSPKKMKEIRYFIGHNKKNDLALWFKKEYNLNHSKITISYGPEVRKWLKNLKGEDYNEI